MQDENPNILEYYLVTLSQNLTAADTYQGTGPTQRVVARHIFLEESEAHARYAKGKASLKVAGAAGMYWTYPVKKTYRMPDRGAKALLSTEDGYCFDITVPARYEVCWRCHGEGTHVNPNIDGHGITSDEMEELGPEFQEDYMSGKFDVFCEECCGKRVLAVPNLQCIPEEIAVGMAAAEESRARQAQDDAAERRWGC